MKNEFHYAFQITRMIIFEVSYYTLGDNKSPYFTTCAFRFNQPKTDWSEGGQAQDRLLIGKAKTFWHKWDKYHLHDLTDQEYTELIDDLNTLKNTYNYICDEKATYAGTSSGLSFYREKELSMLDVKKGAKAA